MKRVLIAVLLVFVVACLNGCTAQARKAFAEEFGRAGIGGMKVGGGRDMQRAIASLSEKVGPEFSEDIQYLKDNAHNIANKIKRGPFVTASSSKWSDNWKSAWEEQGRGEKVYMSSYGYFIYYVRGPKRMYMFENNLAGGDLGMILAKQDNRDFVSY